MSLPWWVLRLATPFTVYWALSPLVVAPVAMAATAVVALLCVLFLSPFDLPWCPLRLPGIALVLWDLVMLAVLIAAWFLAAPADWVGPVLASVAALTLFRIPVWGWLTDHPYHRLESRGRLRWLAAGVGVLLLAGLVTPLNLAPAQRALDCLRPSATSGGGSRWEDATAPSGDTDPDHLVGPAQWTSPEDEYLVSGHGDTVVVMPRGVEGGFAVRAVADGRVLWHVVPDRLRSARSALYDDLRHTQHLDRVHQVGGTVIAEYRAPEGSGSRGLTVGYEAATGNFSWCGQGLWDVVSDSYEPTRFLARDSDDGHHWGLYDAADARLITRLTLDGEDTEFDAMAAPDRALLADGRASVWSDRGFASYAVDSGDLLAAVPLQEERRVSSLLHADGITVVAFGRLRDDDTREQHEKYKVTAYGPDGSQLWDSEGTGPLVEGEPVVGTTLGDCVDWRARAYGVPSHHGFGGYFVGLDSETFERRAAVVRASDGEVVSIIEDELFMASCSMRRYSLNGRLHLDSGAVVDVDGVVTRPHNPKAVPLARVTANGIAVQELGAPLFTFHALP
ncbi:hypothetical protein AB0I72_17635 [Nocardiopsis sp. NPDC049922]|uniref:hypothetical protein n=1 Tax=Nocardiopsis sp. NPDC049922 TaxID=3155157 RepID=UPI0034062244